MIRAWGPSSATAERLPTPTEPRPAGNSEDERRRAAPASIVQLHESRASQHESHRDWDGKAIRVALVEDHHLVREGLRLVLAARGIDVVGESPNGRRGLRADRANEARRRAARPVACGDRWDHRAPGAADPSAGSQGRRPDHAPGSRDRPPGAPRGRLRLCRQGCPQHRPARGDRCRDARRAVCSQQHRRHRRRRLAALARFRCCLVATGARDPGCSSRLVPVPRRSAVNSASAPTPFGATSPTCRPSLARAERRLWSATRSEKASSASDRPDLPSEPCDARPLSRRRDRRRRARPHPFGGRPAT